MTRPHGASSSDPPPTSAKGHGGLRTDDLISVRRRPNPILNIAVDLVSISLAYAGALKLRLALGSPLFTRLDAETLGRITPPAWLLLLLWLISAWWARLYRSGRGVGSLRTAFQVVEAMGLATALTVLLSVALYHDAHGLSRAFLALLFVIGVTCALALRGCVGFVARLARPSAPENVLIVGDGDDATRLVQRLLQTPNSPVTVCGIIPVGGRLTGPVPGVQVFGTIRDLRHAVNQTHADRVLVVDTELPWASLAECFDVCSTMQIPLNYTGGGLTRFPTIFEVTAVAGIRLLEVRREKLEGAQDLMKRATDLIVAGGLLVVLLPLFLVLAIAIKLNTRGPVLYVADRVGRGGRRFRFLKFRSMVPDAEALRSTVHPQGRMDGHIFKTPDDARVTGVGRLMRRWSLDELPQLVNVMRGDMSLVGPRPLPACDLDPDGLSARYRTWSVERSTVRPGLTGLWQVRGRSQLPFEEMVRLDLLYVRSRNYQLDLQILLETLPVVLSGRGAT